MQIANYAPNEDAPSSYRDYGIAERRRWLAYYQTPARAEVKFIRSAVVGEVRGT